MKRPKSRMTRSAKWVMLTLRDHGYEVTSPLSIRRTYAGRHQRAAGAWLWTATRADGWDVAGSIWPIKELMKYSKSEIQVECEPYGHVLEIDPKQTISI